MAIDKTSILDNVETTLQGITTGGGYRTTVDTVERLIKVWSEVGTQQMPWLGFAAIETRRAEDLHPADGQIKCSMLLVVCAHVNAATPILRQAALNNLEDDIIGALCADGGRGTDGGYRNAIDTVWKRTIDDVADPAAPDSRGGSGTMHMEFEITWIRSTGLSPA